MTHAEANGSSGAAVDGAGGLLAGRYRVQGRLGAGGMGVVWLARDERLDRLVAVKQLWPGPLQSGDAAQRVMREGRIAARLRHPHAVTVHDVAEHDGQPVLVMEYVPSRSLAALMAEQGSISPAVAARIGAQAAAALAAAHAAGVVHRDIKPANLLVAEDGTVKIVDFGISRAADDIAVTQAGVVPGTPAYLAPEVVQGQPTSPDSDIYSLGSTLYAAVEGEPPFGEDTDNVIAVLQRVAAGNVPPPRQAGELAPVLLAMLAREPAQRPTAGQVTGALQAIADGRPVDPGMLGPAAARTQPVVTSAPTVPVVPGYGPAGTRMDNRLGPEPPPGSRPRPWASRPRLVVALTVALVLIVAVVFVATRAGDGSGTATAPPPAPTSPATLDPATITSSVSAYYALLPAQPDQAWGHLGPTLQQQGLSAYRTYWSTITGLTVTGPPRITASGSATVDLRLTLDNGTVVTETHQLGLTPADPAPLITSDTVTGSTTSTAAPPPPAAPPAHATPGDPGNQKNGGTGKKGGNDHKGPHG